MFDCPWALRPPAHRIVVAMRGEDNGSTVSDFGHPRRAKGPILRSRMIGISSSRACWESRIYTRVLMMEEPW